MEKPLFELAAPVAVLDLLPVAAGLDAGHLVLDCPAAVAGAHGHLDVPLVQTVHQSPHFLMSRQTLWKPLR